MVYEVKGSQQQTADVITNLDERCATMIYKAKCIASTDERYIKPVTDYYAELDPPITMSNDPVRIAWNLLRQGGLLCTLLNHYRSNTISKINEIEGGTVKDEKDLSNKDAKQNVENFLNSCRVDLYMQDADLFAAEELYTENTNVLSKTLFITEKFFEKLYKTYRIPFERKIAEFKAREEELNAASRRNSVTSSGSTSDVTNMRLMVLNEFVKSENVYITDLEKLIRYREELVADKVVSEEVLQKIFGNLLDLADFQRQYSILVGKVLTKAALKDLEASYEAHMGRKLFIEMESKFAVYNDYVANRAISREAISQNLNNLMEKAKLMDPQGTLDAYLIKPIQRICKYPLLLREILKNSADNAKDREELQQAFEVANRITTKINELMAMGENAAEVENMKTLVAEWSIKNIKIDPNQLGRLYRWERVSQLAKEGGINAEIVIYLFERALLICRQGKASIISNRPILILRACLKREQIKSIEDISNQASQLHALRFNVVADGDPAVAFAFKVINTESIKLWKKACEALKIPEVASTDVIVGLQDTNKRLSYGIRKKEQLVPEPTPAAKSGPIPVSTPAVAVAMAKAQEKANDYPPGALQIKIIYNNECYIRLIPNLPSIEQIKRFAIKTINADFERFDLQFPIPKEYICLKYLDDDKDLINIMDQNDLTIAQMCNGSRLTIHVFDMRHVDKGGMGN